MDSSGVYGWWRRIGSGEEGHGYVDSAGRPLAMDQVRRIESLVIPPAWREVHISPDPEHKIQAWGRDAAGRKQYIYSRDHVARRESRKWRRVLDYGLALPLLRDKTNLHLKQPPHHRDRVLATVVRLMSRACFRVGSERYAVQNRTFGICTLSKSHLRVEGNTLHFHYAGKRRIHQRRIVADTPLVEIVGEMLLLPGSRLFQYRDEGGRVRPVTAGSVNSYLGRILGRRYTSKDLRTFGGTVRAATVLAELGPPATPREARGNIALCCRLVALELGNTPAIARSAYIHPVVLRQYEEAGLTIDATGTGIQPVPASEPMPLYPEEAALIEFLERFT
jgi:DNA topoisomerase I